MGILRHTLPAGLAAVEFCPKHIVIVSAELSEPEACRAGALVRARCNGLFSALFMEEVAYPPKTKPIISAALRAT